jgi:hypothetical protein
VRSTPGEGSTFTVALRRVAQPPPVDAAGSLTDRRALDERREEERGAGDDRRAADAEGRAAIPPALDRALAAAVLDAVRAGGVRDAGGADGGPAVKDAAPRAVAEAVARVADALAAQGVDADAVLLALDDAFAALLAGQQRPAQRAHVGALGASARQATAARLGPRADAHVDAPLGAVGDA